MSLMERVRLAARAADTSALRPQGNRLDELKREVQHHLTSDEIASIMAENPYRAKNEIRSVCSHVFESGQWESLSGQEQGRLVDELIDTVFGLGPLETMLADESITEIMVNGAQKIYYERNGKLYPSRFSFANDDQVRALIDRVIGPLGRRVDEASPMVNARLTRGHRVNVVLPPLSLDGPILTIRKFREHLYTLEEMVTLSTMDDQIRQLLEWAVASRKNIAVSGGTGSGKTTLLNALSCAIPVDERIITIEDSAELKFSHHPHVIRLEARPRNAEGTGEVSIRDLVINALRMRPDRVIVGECRGGEALDMLQAMNTGHDGSLTTLHANSPSDALVRISTMVRYAVDIPVAVIEAQVASAIDMIVQTIRATDGHRYVQEIASFDYSRDALAVTVATHYSLDLAVREGRWSSAPQWIDDLHLYGIATVEEVSRWKSNLSISA